MKQLTLEFDGYATIEAQAAGAASGLAQNVRTNIKRVASQSALVLGAAAAGAKVLALALLPAGFVLATGADTIPQALAALACFAAGAWPLGAYESRDKRMKGGAV